MPELPEVETVVRGLHTSISGKKIRLVQVNRRDLRFPIPSNFESISRQAVITSITRRAKYLLMHLDCGMTVIGHLGMSGRMLLTPKSSYIPAKHDHIIWEFDGHERLVFNDARRFGFMLLAPTADLAKHQMFQHLGSEPLTEAFDVPYMYQRMQGKTVAVKQWLMDNKNVVGIGNIYACEALYMANIDPTKSVGLLDKPAINRLVPAIKTVLERAIEAGGSSLKDYVQASGTLGYFQHQF